MKKIGRIILLISIFLIAFFLLFLFISTIQNYRPQREVLFRKNNAKIINDTLRIFSWNIGYAGLGQNMDFFYDGGKTTRDTQENTENNLKFIGEYIAENNSDIILLQEVDINSKRSYNINQMSRISNVLINNFALAAPNYKVDYVPIPIFKPMGKVESGLVTSSKIVPQRAEHIPYNTEEKWPIKIFSLDRCILVFTYKCKNNRNLLVVNTHNSAFDDKGLMRRDEMKLLKEYITEEYEKGNYVIVGGDWNQTPPLVNIPINFDLNAKTEQFKPLQIEQDYMPNDWTWVTDGLPTNRFLNESYVKGKTQETLIDFFLISPNVELLGFKRFNLEFKHSDHNPIELSVTLK